MKNQSRNLWEENTPPLFWLPQIEIPEHVWYEAYQAATSRLNFPIDPTDIQKFLAWTLGEARFGSQHWDLSVPKRIYYLVKPAIPRVLSRLLRRLHRHASVPDPRIEWPIEKRYVEFLWEVMTQILKAIPKNQLTIKSLWPKGWGYAFVLTHDIESSSGQSYVREVADLEQNLGFRSSFNFVPERYRVDEGLISELRQRGFEVGLHGLKHDGKLFSSRTEFGRRANKINQYLNEFGAAGFRSPLTHRNPEWMQVLNIEYDLSFFDSDPFEPIPGGSMSIWPFFIGHFVELPYTLIQDYTLTSILDESTPRLWLEKVDFLKRYNGMALMNSHPDYLKDKTNWDVYRAFLLAMQERGNFWHALPMEVAAWWRHRRHDLSIDGGAEEFFSTVSLTNGEVKIMTVH